MLGLGPREVDDLEIWEVAAIIGGNDSPTGDADNVEPEFNLNERPNPDGPTIFAAWRALAIADGKEPPKLGDRISKVEYDRVRGSIEGGRKGAG